ncbi:MAG: phosphoribosylformylglycinamidine synthase subunit PurQ [Polyangiaceae bacterium]|nr:phosphoribosylformylglycinamidine synthase subunit PurQ [Polyangiaceae bacterium]
MHAAVVVFPGSNADAELIRTLRDVVGVRTSVAWHGDSALPDAVDLVAIPGGFSYGDYLRCGAIARTSPIVADIRRHAERGGLVLGICNGFQILTECGLLPGALTRNAHLRFECRDIFLRPRAKGPFTSSILAKKQMVLRLPIAHAEGRYQVSSATLADLKRATDAGDGDVSPAIAFDYVDRNGAVVEAANPNGSIESIAGVYGGPKRNVMGLMPHPERMSEPLHGGEDGRLLFEAAVESAARAPSGAKAS